jgi:uncharacterized paraquat-inducible protein A
MYFSDNPVEDANNYWQAKDEAMRNTYRKCDRCGFEYSLEELEEINDKCYCSNCLDELVEEWEEEE